MRTRNATRLTTGLALLLLIPVDVLHTIRGDFGADVLFSAALIVLAGLALRIDVAQPGHGTALRLGIAALALAWMGLADGLAYVDEDVSAPVTRWGAILDSSSFQLMLPALGAIILGFPSGRAPSPRWARAERRFYAFLAIGIVIDFLAEDEDLARHAQTPVGVLPDAFLIVTMASVLGLAIWLVAIAIDVRRRFKRATGIERLQLSWLAYGAASVPAVILLCFAGWILPVDIGAPILIVPLLLIPATIAVAVTRYRLYDIDQLVNRTLVYGALSLVLIAVYAVIAIGLGVLVGRGTSWATAAATLAVALAFRPARDRAQLLVDRRFARRRYAGLQRVRSFLEDVRAGRAEPERLAPMLADALGDDGVEVFFALPATGGYADGAGRLCAPPEDDLRAATPITRGDLELGVVLHHPRLAETPDTLESVLKATGLAMEIARLRVELRVQLAEVEASRARLIAAAEAERTKLERDLHDGAQQRLVALGLALRHAQHQIGADDPAAALTTIDDAIGELAASIAELRELARGLRPSLLDHGLGPALTEVAERAPVPVRVEVAPGTLPPRVETAAYYLAVEGLTNAVKHAGARQLRVRVDRSPVVLRIEVADDGAGGAHIVPGGGLAGLSARASAQGGTLSIDSPPGRGTRLVAELPCG